MDKKGGAVQFAVFIFLIALVTYLVLYLPGVDISKPITEKITACDIIIQNSSMTFVEGEGGSMTFSMHTNVGGAYGFELYKAPHFSSLEISTKVIPAASNVDMTILFANATPAKDKNEFITQWNNAEILVSGPADCKATFSVSVSDNCPGIYNPDQKDSDNDGMGDVCDASTCNNSICEPGENSTNCCNDCGCVPGQTCNSNACEGEAFKCLVHSDCKDNNKCTRDLCFHPNTINAHCGHEEILSCSKDNSDGCCPDGCNANEDIDCEPDCGNAICEDFFDKENYSSCHYDCPPE